MYKYKTKGTCSTSIEIELDNGTIKRVRFQDGCKGNLEAMARLVQGMNVEDAIARLKGIPCGANTTSCADQLATALAKMRAEGLA